MRVLKIITLSVVFTVCLGWFPFAGQAQVITNNGASIFVASGAVLTVKGGFTNSISGAAVENNGIIQLTEDWQLVNSAQYSGTGTLELNGTNRQLINATSIHHLIINNPAGATLQGNLNITGDLTFSEGNLSGVGNTLNLEGAVSETADRMYEGALVKTIPVTAATAVSSFGNIGVEFNNSADGDWGNVTVTRNTGPGSSISNPNAPLLQGINRHWSIEPQYTPAGKTIDLTLSWFTDENNGLEFPGNKAQVWKSEDKGSTWVKVDGLKTVTTTGNLHSITVQATPFSLWTVSDEANPLPVTWLSFEGKATGQGNELIWATASEVNSDFFEVQRSSNGKDFTEIGRESAGGHSSTLLCYGFVDDQLPVQGRILYYRLRQVDLDRKFEYSKVIAIDRKGKVEALKVSVSPNPFTKDLTVRMNSSVKAARFRLFDAHGKLIYHRQHELREGEVSLEEFSHLAVGLYLLEVTAEGTTQVLKLIKE